MKYKVSIVDRDGSNVIEYEYVGDTIFAISSRKMTRDNMRKIEEYVGLNSHLGVVSINYQERFFTGKMLTVWSVTDFEDCNWE